MSVEIIVAVIGSVSILSVALIKKFYSPNSGSQNIIDKTIIQKDIERLEEIVDEYKQKTDKLVESDMVHNFAIDQMKSMLEGLKEKVDKLWRSNGMSYFFVQHL